MQSKLTMPTKRRFVLLPLAAFLLAIGAYAQDAGKFTGTWKGEHAGKTYLVMTIAAGSPLKISFITANIHVDENGEISVEGPVEHEEQVLESKIDGDSLRFKTRQDDGDTIDYELRLEGEGAASLTIVGEPATVKPFRLRRS